MNTLTLHIEYLLRRHDCVILPGVGAFMRTRRDACIDMERGVAMPAMYVIGFNADVNNEDAMLANSYSRRMRVSFSEGKRALQRDIDALVQKLADGSQAEIGHIGVLFRGEENRVQFRKTTASEDLSRIGYVPAAIPKLPDSTTKAPDASIVENVPDKEVKQETAATGEAPARMSDRRYVTWRIRKTWLGAAACAMVALLCLSVFVGSRFNPSMQKSPIQQAAVVPAIDRIDTATQPDAPALEAEQSIPEAGIEADADEEAYYLIVATFKNAEDAHTFVGRKSDSRYPLMVVRGEKVYRVSAAMSSERHELRDIMKEREFASRFVQPWIWHRD